MHVAGVDGTKGGWVAIALDEDGRFASDHVLRPVETDFAELADALVIAVDVPIGYGPRRADSAARAFLTGAGSTVFTTARREVLEVPFGPGLGVSAQSHALGPRIIHITTLATVDSRLYEVHPEVCFRAMNDGRALRHRKKSSGGALERVELLNRHGIELSRLAAAATAPLDDVLDAAAAAWSAQRIIRGVARTLPDPPEDLGGRPVAIWYQGVALCYLGLTDYAVLAGITSDKMAVCQATAAETWIRLAREKVQEPEQEGAARDADLLGIRCKRGG